MNSYQKSQLMRNIARYKLGSRIGKIMLSVTGSGIRMGEHVSRTPGYSPVILDYRHYTSGDPVKDIDWKLSARTEKIFIKIREGYRQTDFVIAIDNSESMKTDYSVSPSKFITGLTIAYITARIALKSRDKVYIIWNGERMQVSSEQGLIDLLVNMESDMAYKDFWETPFDSGANFFLISDFFTETDKFIHYIRNISHQSNNIYSFIIQDPIEKNFDFKGRYNFLDPESDASLLTRTRDIEKKYNEYYHDHFAKVAHKSKSYGIKSGIVSTDKDPFNDFLRILS